ncbi:MAG: calcium/sodium antiporter [Bacteroidales bacterium]|nr:calcium/sodium antiporter [Bacteroidales bacterium]
MILTIVGLIVSLVLVTVGADAIVSGASSIAKRFGVSEFVIGLTIVALGTSAPEMVVSFIGAIEGNADISVGNIIGSNIFNVAVILGLSALIRPIAVTKNNVRRDIPVNIVVTAMLIVFGILDNHTLTRLNGAIFLAGFLYYIWYSFRHDDKAGNGPKEENPDQTPEKPKALYVSIPMVILGLGALIFGGELFVKEAQTLARAIGLSDKVIAITVLAGGTSLPELATSLVAAIKGKGQLALGNIIGSNVFNILLILGGSALIRPLSTASINLLDYAVLGGTSLLLMLEAICGKERRINRFEGALLFLCGLAYMTYLCL